MIGISNPALYLILAALICLIIAEAAKLLDREDAMSMEDSPRLPIPMIGEVSSPAELVDLLKRAHFARLAAAEHGVDLDDRYVPAQAVTEDREAA